MADVRLPDGKILVPGVIGHATDLVEHPGLVAERLVNYASVVGMENLRPAPTAASAPASATRRSSGPSSAPWRRAANWQASNYGASEGAGGMAYDLLIKGGHVLDPGQDLDAALDIAIAGGKIAKIAADIGRRTPRASSRCAGPRHVVPGLIDLHTHVANGAVTQGVGMGSCDADDIGVRSGVTTVADCGSVGVANLGVFPAHILPKAKTRIITLVNAGSHAHTMPGAADVNSPGDINRDALAKAAAHNPGSSPGSSSAMSAPPSRTPARRSSPRPRRPPGTSACR